MHRAWPVSATAATQVVVGEVGRGHLVAGEAVALERGEALLVPRRAQRDQAALAAAVEGAEQLLGRAAGTGPAGRGCTACRGPRRLAAALAVQRAEVAELELGAVGAGVGGPVDEVERPVEAAVVVDADLGDHERRLVVGDEAAVELQVAAGGDDATATRWPLLVDEGHVARRGRRAGRRGRAGSASTGAVRGDGVGDVADGLVHVEVGAARRPTGGSRRR